MRSSWSVIDFVLVILGGLVGAGIAAAVIVAAESNELALVLGIAGQYLGHLFVFWLIARSKEDPDIGLAVEGQDLRYLPLGLLLQLVLAIVFFPLTSLLFSEGDQAQQIGDFISGLQTTPARIGAVLVAVVLAPVTEEMMFRGVLLKALGDRSRRALILIPATVFVLFHVLGLDPNNFWASAAVVLPQLFVIGIALGWLVLRTGRLGPAIFLHSGYNLLAALTLLLPPEVLENLTG